MTEAEITALASRLYDVAAYYRRFAPYMLDIPEAEYEQLQEAKNADLVLSDFRRAVGGKEEPKRLG